MEKGIKRSKQEINMEMQAMVNGDGDSLFSKAQNCFFML